MLRGLISIHHHTRLEHHGVIRDGHGPGQPAGLTVQGAHGYGSGLTVGIGQPVVTRGNPWQPVYSGHVGARRPKIIVHSIYWQHMCTYKWLYNVL
jgi:hypothetical protein